MEYLKSRKDEFLTKVIRKIEENLANENYSVDELAASVGLSRSMLHRKLKKLIGKSVGDLITQIRLEKARELLENDVGTSSEIAYRVGFNSPSYFNKVFKKYFGVSPGELRKNPEDFYPEDREENKSDVSNTTGVNLKEILKRSWKISAGTVFIIFAIILIIFIINRANETRALAKLEKSIAVLQFQNLGSDEEQQWFCQGMTDIIISQLSKIQDYRILGRTSTLKYTKGEKSIAEIGEELNVNFIIEGSVQRVADRVRISIQLVRVKNEDQLWSEIYDMEWKDIFSIQSNIAINVAKELNTALSSNEKVNIEKNTTSSSDAYELYLEGKYYWNLRTKEGISKSIELFNKAINIDSNYALAYSGLSVAYNVAADWNFFNHDSALNLSLEYALMALLLDNEVAETYASLGIIAVAIYHNYPLAKACFKRAQHLNPSYSSAYQWHALNLMKTGKLNEAIKTIEKAVELDPGSLIINYATALIYYIARKYDKAILQLDKTQYMDTESSIFNTITRQKLICYLQLKEYEKVMNHYVLLISDDSLRAVYQNNAADIYQKEGEIGLINFIIAHERQRNNLSYELLSILYSHINNNEQALACIEEMFERKLTHYDYILVEPAYDSLHAEPRFIKILESTGLAPYTRAKLLIPGPFKQK